MRTLPSSICRATALLAVVVAILMAGNLSAGAQAADGDPVRVGRDSYRVQRWTSADGLLGDRVFDLQITPEGYVWAEGYAGGTYFDGARFVPRNLNAPGALSGARLSQVVHAPDGTVYGALEAGRVGSRAHLAQLRDGAWEILAEVGTVIYDMSLAPDGAMWMSVGPGDTGEEAVARWANGELSWFAVPTSDFAWSILADSAGTVWVGFHSAGLFRWDGEEFVLEDGVGRPASVSEILEDDSGRLWIGGRGEVAYQDAEGSWRAITDDRLGVVRGLIIDDRGYLWTGSEYGELYRTERTTQDPDGPGGLVEIATFGSSITGAAIDEEGGVWFGLLWDGVVRVHRDRLPTLGGMTVDNRLSTGYLFSPVPAPGETSALLVSEACNLLRVREDGSRVRLPGSPINPITRAPGSIARSALRPGDDGCVVSVAVDEHGDIWYLAGNRLSRLEDGVGVEYPPVIDGLESGSYPRHLAAAGAGTLWYLINGQGLVRATVGGEQTFYPMQYPVAFGQRVVVRPGLPGEVWYASEDSFGRATAAGITEYSVDEFLDGTAANDIYVDADGVAWLGTRGAGVVRIDGDEMRRLTLDDGLHDDRADHILETRDGKLWIVGDRGVSVVGRAELSAYMDGELDRIDIGFLVRTEGLPRMSMASNASVVQSNGNVWLLGLGATVFHPDEIEWHDAPRTPIVETVDVDGVSLGSSGRLTVPAGAHSIDLEYTLPTFADPEYARFRYRLDGYDEDWIEAGNRRFVSYSSLWPGTYTFRVVARTNFGAWSGEEAVVQLEVLPLWWQTGWFAAFAVLSLVGLGAAIQTARSAAVRRRNVELQREIDARNVAEVELKGLSQRMVSAQEEDRARIARDLHDDISQRLQAAAIGVEPAIRAFRDAPEDAEKRLHEVQDQLDAVAQDTRRMSHELHPAMLEMLGFTAALEGLCEEFGSAADVETSVEVGDDVEAALGPQAALGLYRITQEALRNVDKHAEADQVIVTLTVEGSRVRMRVTDDGQGFEAGGSGAAQSGLGVASMRERARLLNGSLRVDSTLGAGTELLVELPIEDP